MFELFLMGGVSWMTLLTIELIGILLAAFKAPRWVGHIGSIAICTGILSTLFGLYGAFDALSIAPDVSSMLVYAGMKVALIPVIYGMLIYVVSQGIRIAQRPRM